MAEPAIREGLALRTPLGGSTRTRLRAAKADRPSATAARGHANSLANRACFTLRSVPPQNTYLVMEALIKANKDFDVILLPAQPHGYGVDGPYVMRRRFDYFEKNLLGLEPPKEFKMQPVAPPGRPAGN